MDKNQPLPGMRGFQPPQADTPGQARAAASLNGRSVQQAPAPDTTQGHCPVVSQGKTHRFAIGNPHMCVNHPAPDWIPLEMRVESPPFSPTLENDDVLVKDLQEPEFQGRIQELLQERQRLKNEKSNEEFRFKLLMPTLRNMRTFIQHISDNKQFRSPLTAADRKTMDWLAEQAQSLIDAQAPYERTVHLAFALVAVCESLTNRWVLGPLKKQDPSFYRKHCEKQEWLPEPEEIATFCWGGNNTKASQEKKEFFSVQHGLYGQLALSVCLNASHLLLYPSFQALDLDDFCRFGHLPVHPIGMTTAYACNADGCLMGPLSFALHDAFHMTTLSTINNTGYTPDRRAEHQLCQSSQRLALRQWLLDKVPERLYELTSQQALILVVFHLFHEADPGGAAEYLDLGRTSFLSCLQKLGEARRRGRSGYNKAYRDVTDSQAIMAVLWTIRLWESWKAINYRSLEPAQQDRVMEQFWATDVPRLRNHLTFIEQHRGALRQLFAENCSKYAVKDNHLMITVRADGRFLQQALTLFESYDAYSGLLNLDNTDMAYFSALNYPHWRQKIEARVGVPLPEGTGYQPGTCQEGQDSRSAA